jgi:DNA-directed RNA polymerase, sigma subunit (sigma70/sigma32)
VRAKREELMGTDQEIIFARTLEKVKKLAREQGNSIEKEQVEDAFRGLDLSKEQLSLVFEYLEKNKIGIGTVPDPDEFLSREEIDYLEEYKKELAGLAELAEGEKEALILSAMAGEPDAQKRLIPLYLTRVVEISRLYAGQGVLVDDLIGEGNVALAQGVSMLGCLEHAGEADGMLTGMVMDAMERSIAQYVSEADKDKKVLSRVRKVAKKAADLSRQLRRKVTVEELAAESGMDEEVIRDALRFCGYAIEDIG